MESTPPPRNDDRERRVPGTLRKAAVAGIGGTVTAAGLVMLVTPGPGILVSVAGLAILAKEFPAAARQLERIRARTRRHPAEGNEGAEPTSSMDG